MSSKVADASIQLLSIASCAGGNVFDNGAGDRARSEVSQRTMIAVLSDSFLHRRFASTHQGTLPEEKLSSILQSAYNAAPKASQYAQDEHILSGLQRDDDSIRRIAQRDAETPISEGDSKFW